MQELPFTQGRGPIPDIEKEKIRNLYNNYTSFVKSIGSNMEDITPNLDYKVVIEFMKMHNKLEMTLKDFENFCYKYDINLN
jgi:Fe-S-cluster formation regulator IscX/YfhJ